MRRNTRLLSALLGIFSLCMMTLNFARLDTSVEAQAPACTSVQGYGSTQAFAQNSKINVNVSNSNGTQQDGVRKAFAEWQKFNGSTGTASGIVVDRYTYQATAGTGTQVRVVFGTPSGGVRGTSSRSSDGTVTITIDSRVTSQQAVLEVMLHELGHALFGLKNCESTDGDCSRSKTIMGYAPPCSSDAAVASWRASDPSLCPDGADYNATDGVDSPTTCDINAAKTNGNYDPTKTNPPQPNPPATGGNGGASPRPEDYYHHPTTCYMAVMITNWYQCYGSGGCYYVGSTYQSMGIYCY
jgi:hypothetical protein